MPGLYMIVEFLSTKEVEDVPSIWVEDGVCKWHKYSAERCKRAVTNEEEPTETWTEYDVRILRTADNYRTAREKLPQAMYTSDLATSADESDRPAYKKRKRNPTERARPVISDSEEEELCVLPQAPRRALPVFEPMASASSSGLPEERVGAAADSPVAFPIDRSPVTPVTPVTPQNLTCPVTLQQVFSLLEKLNARQEQMANQITMIIAMLNNGRGVGGAGLSGEMPEEIGLPILDEAALDEAEAILENADVKKKLIAYLSTIGGSSIKETVWRLLAKTFTNSLARKINWSGANGKRCFSSLSLKTVVMSAVRRNYSSSKATEGETEAYIKRWFQLAGDREGGRKERSLRKNPPTTQ